VRAISIADLAQTVATESGPTALPGIATWLNQARPAIEDTARPKTAQPGEPTRPPH